MGFLDRLKKKPKKEEKTSDEDLAKMVEENTISTYDTSHMDLEKGIPAKYMGTTIALPADIVNANIEKMKELGVFGNDVKSEESIEEKPKKEELIHAGYYREAIILKLQELISELKMSLLASKKIEILLHKRLLNVITRLETGGYNGALDEEYVKANNDYIDAKQKTVALEERIEETENELDEARKDYLK
tara:strand:+ start:4 stop:573 length:570 start_codon:yes stop_codon:yes gene_type:complete